MRCRLKMVSGDICPPIGLSSLIGRAISQQYAKRQEWPDRNELLVHEVFLRERQAFDEGPSLRYVFAVQYEDDAPAVAAREPLLNLAVEIQGNGRANFGGHDFHDLLDSNPRFWRKDRQHAGDLGLRRCGLTLRHGRQDRRESQQQEGHSHRRHCSASLIPHGIWILLGTNGYQAASLDAREEKRLRPRIKIVVLYGTRVGEERVMATASMSKSRQKDADETVVRERILDAAFTAFIKSGYATASTLEIATRARVSKRELYALVGNKQETLIACISERAKRLDVDG